MISPHSVILTRHYCTCFASVTPITNWSTFSPPSPPLMSDEFYKGTRYSQYKIGPGRRCSRCAAIIVPSEWGRLCSLSTTGTTQNRTPRTTMWFKTDRCLLDLEIVCRLPYMSLQRFRGMGTSSSCRLWLMSSISARGTKAVRRLCKIGFNCPTFEQLDYCICEATCIHWQPSKSATGDKIVHRLAQCGYRKGKKPGIATGIRWLLLSFIILIHTTESRGKQEHKDERKNRSRRSMQTPYIHIMAPPNQSPIIVGPN